MADQGGNNNNNQNNNSIVVMREYRKGNWTVNETMVLIEAKKMDDERRMRKSGGCGGGGSGDHSSKPTELRWKWVEDYCWRKGCLRSQNQCNDKWDNLMRDYKKVREYQRRIMAASAADDDDQSHRQGGCDKNNYWEMERNERKEKNLPSNMLRQIYDRLEEVVEKKNGGADGGQRVVAMAAAPGVASGGGGVLNLPYVMDRPVALPLLQQHQLPPAPPIPAAIPLPLPAPPPTVSPPPIIEPPSLSYAQPALPPVGSLSLFSISCLHCIFLVCHFRD